MAVGLPVDDVVMRLSDLFTLFDKATLVNNIYKLQTCGLLGGVSSAIDCGCACLCRIGDAYVCVSGLAFTQPDQASECATCRSLTAMWCLMAASAKSEEEKAEDAAHRLVQMVFSTHEAVRLQF